MKQLPCLLNLATGICPEQVSFNKIIITPLYNVSVMLILIFLASTTMFSSLQTALLKDRSAFSLLCFIFHYFNLHMYLDLLL